jgi:hypothetical protein
MGGVEIDESGPIKVVKSSYVGGGENEQGKNDVIANTISSELIDTRKVMIDGVKSASIPEQVAAGMSSNGLVRGEVFIKPVIVDGNRNVVENVFADEKAEEDYLILQERYMSNVKLAEQSYDKGDYSEDQ